MKKSFNLYLAFALSLVLIVFTSCKDHDHEPHDHEQELITTLTLTMTPHGGGTPVTATFKDLDGPGGSNPVMTPEQVVLRANTLYHTSVKVLDESHHAEDLTAEIKEKGNEHEFFYVPSPANLLTITKTDRDSNSLPIGLESTMQTGAAGSGTLRVVLKHQPGLKNANSTIDAGETDVDVTYNIVIQ